MRPTLATALGIIAALIATSLFVPGLAGAHAPLASTGAGPSASSVTVTTTTDYGAAQNAYTSGLSSGRVFFTVTDSMGATDGNATVRIYDHNATRDGVPTPAATFSVRVSSGVNYSSDWNIFYHIPLGLVFGGQWNITVQATAGGFAYQNFTVRTYAADAAIAPSEVLPADNVSTTVLVYFTSNEAPYHNVTGVVVTGTYTTPTGTATLAKVRLGGSAISYDNFTIPANAEGPLYLTVYANTTSAGYNVSSVTSASAYVGNLTQPVVTLSSSPTGPSVSAFPVGTPVYVTVTELISGTGRPAPGVTTAFKFEKGASFVTPPGNPPSSVVTNQQGQAAISFIASGSVFSMNGPNYVVVTVHDDTDPQLGSLTQTTSFGVYNTTTTPSITLSWSSSEYYAGAAATAHWTLGGQNASVLSGWTGSFWLVESTNGQSLYRIGEIPSGETSGTISLQLPSAFTGGLYAVVIASNATSEVDAISYTTVEPGMLFLTPSENSYLPGDNIHVDISTSGPTLTGATLWATVVDGAGNFISNGPVSGGSLSISVPSNAPPTSYVVTVVAQTPTGGNVANASVTLTEASGIDLEVGISTASNYLDGSYQPGETVTVHYAFTARGVASLPQTYVLTLSPSSGYTTNTVDVSGSSGSFQYTIPKDAANGLLSVSVGAKLGGPSCITYCSASSHFTADVNGNPAPLSYQFGNSGFSLGALIFIVVLIVLALIVLLMVRRRGGMGGRPMVMRPEPAAGTGSSSSPSGTSGSSGSSSSSSPSSHP